MTTYISFPDIYDTLRQFPGYRVQYSVRPETGGGRDRQRDGVISDVVSFANCVQVSFQQKKGQLSAEADHVPSPGYRYSRVVVLDENDDVIQDCAPPAAAVAVAIDPTAQIAQALAATHDDAAGQRSILLADQRNNASRASAERLDMVNMILAMEAKAESQRQVLLDLQAQAAAEAKKERAAEAAKAEHERKMLLQQQAQAAADAKQERAHEAAKAEAERKMLLSAIQALQGSANAHPPRQAQSQSHRSRSPDSSDDEDGAATDVDDDNSCSIALERWKSRHCSIPKQKRHLSAWYAGEMDEVTFTSAWARKLEPATESGTREVAEGLSLETILTALHRGLHSRNTNVARYAVTIALQEAMVMAQRCQMRQERATGEAMSEFDTSITTNDRKCRRRATDYCTIEVLAASAIRKHAKKRKETRDRRERDRSRSSSRTEQDTKAPSSHPKVPTK